MRRVQHTSFLCLFVSLALRTKVDICQELLIILLPYGTFRLLNSDTTEVKFKLERVLFLDGVEKQTKSEKEKAINYDVRKFDSDSVPKPNYLDKFTWDWSSFKEAESGPKIRFGRLFHLRRIRR